MCSPNLLGSILSILRGSNRFIPFRIPKVLVQLFEMLICDFSSLTISSNGGFTTYLLAVLNYYCVALSDSF